MNTPVNFETAKLLKEKGFDVWYKLKYSSFSRINDAEDFCKKFPNKLTEDSYEISKGQDNEGSIYSCSITLNEFEYTPTIAEVVMWIYEKHGIWIFTECDCYGLEWYSKISVASQTLWENLDKRPEVVSAFRKLTKTNRTPPEAYEQAIEYTVKNLI